MSDLRYALRQLWKEPGFTLMAVLTLALGIGATTALYSVVNAVLLNPIPGHDTDRLVQVGEWFKLDRGEAGFHEVSPPTLQLLRAQTNHFDDFTWCVMRHLEDKGNEFTDTVLGAWVSPNFFDFLKISPLLGRGFSTDERSRTDDEGNVIADSVIVLSHSLWQSRYGGDREILGRNLKLSGRNFTVVGVMPPHFGFPWGNSHFWLPMEDPPVKPELAEAPNYMALVRLKSETDLKPAKAWVAGLADRLRQDYSKDDWQGQSGYGNMFRREGWDLKIRPMREIFIDENLQRTLLGLLGAIGFVLLIVCANIGNLMLARTERRQQELAIRAALGATRLRIVIQMLTESLLLAGLGCIGGLLITSWGMKLLSLLIPAGMPRLNEIQIDSTALAASVLVSVVAGILFGLAPALRASRTSVNDALKEAGARATSGRAWKYYRGGLVVSEVALALLLLSGAALMIQSVVRLLKVDPGFDTQNLLRVYVSLPWQKYGENPALKNPVLEQLHERLSSLPGVEAVGIGKEDAWTPNPYELDGSGRTAKLLQYASGVEASDLFRAMRTPLRSGRTFTRADIKAKMLPVVINETMAESCWPGQNALGKKFSTPGPGSKTRYEVIGVAGDTLTFSYNHRIEPTFYRPFHEMFLAGAPLHFIVRTASNPEALAPAIRKEIKAAEPEMGTPQIHAVRQDLYQSTQAQRTYMYFLVSFATVGLVLCAIGIYGVLAYSVARRTREIGIRMAVGAERSDVMRMIVSEGSVLAGIGIIVGLIMAAWLTRFLESQLFDVSPMETSVFVVVVLFLMAVAGLASFLPARKAARVQPVEALRHE